ncbi:U3 small nucleolar RNA-associated protein 18 homolog [Macrosteles quadrilineatus]|uniref:U3 small nucleolar RNA-associated protein 18 homolog n=1 Tax=Macrosteles quadrilineatus TaxID=74068 RepID=UPI0023E333D3|nr:U3 small nucleolar RNA-associated protein 18 homolog [Macrosteles quadrilineatus]
MSEVDPIQVEKSAKRKKSGLNKNEESELESLEKLLLGRGKNVLDNATVEDAGSRKKIKKAFKPAWEDPDDSSLNVNDALSAQGRPKMGVPGKPSDQYQTVLKKRFETRIGNPEWARLDRQVENEDEEELLKRCGNFIEKQPGALTKGSLDIKKLQNLNKSTGREGPFINSLQFHQTSTVALVAGSGSIASIFQVDGLTNPHLQSVKFDRFPVRCARFSQDGSQFIVGSQHHSHYFVYDMMEGRTIRVPTHHTTEQTNMKKFEVSPDGRLIAVCGRFGNIHLLHARTKEWIGALKMNGEVTAICFSPSGDQLWSHGDSGEVYVWDTASRKCLHRFTDEGCIHGTSIAISPSNQLVACGSRSGVVNVYEAQSVLKSSTPQPAKALLHLVTSATFVKFNPTSQILTMASDDKEGALKLVHMPSMTVFSNFPAKDSFLGRVNCLDFSPGSGYMAAGNSQHTAQLYRLKHFGNY